MIQRSYLSRYVIGQRINNSLLSLFSTRTGKHALLDVSKDFALSAAICRRERDVSDCTPDNLSYLQDSGFIVKEGIDELECLRRERDVALREGQGVRVAVLPTRACNFSCLYCYQRPESSGTMMSEHTGKNLVAFIHRQLRSVSNGPLIVMWFGGEPLLSLPSIRRLSAELTSLADELRLGFHSSIITNGYYLGGLTPQIISELRLSTIQVTIDGPREIHDQRRPRRGGGPTFDTIMKNVAAVCRYFQGIVIRINVDASNFEQVPDLLTELRDRGILEYCRYTTAAVDLNTGVCQSDCCPTLKPEEWAIIDEMIEVEARRIGVHHRCSNSHPTPSPLACSAQAANAFVVDPDGLVFKCLNDTSIPGRAIDNVNGGLNMNSSRADDLAASTPFGKIECETCLYLPVCNAGCPSVNAANGFDGHICTHYKYSLKARLARYANDYSEKTDRHSSNAI